MFNLETVRKSWPLGSAMLTLALATACSGSGGSGGVSPIPAPSPSPTPTPTPTPSPSPTSSFLTAEYRRSSGPSQHDAITAWAAGNFGTGVTIGIIDTGIDTDNPEFAGRIAEASRDVVGSNRGGLDNPDDDHGTQVALTAAAARDGLGIMGIAYNATIAMFRADSVGSCAPSTGNVTESGCYFEDDAIVTGIDEAVAAKARIINLSLGGGSPSFALRNAISRAAQAGVVIVVSAGNDGKSTEDGIDPTNPDPFARGLRGAGNGNVIIAGSVDENNVISGFSNKAGEEAQWYLAARGEDVCCVYENGTMKVVSNPDGTTSTYVVSGTSFSAPQIAGAAALLLQAFPKLTAVEVVDLLLTTARTAAGTADIDPIYGHGILDIAAAFAPQGQTSLAGSTTAMPLGDSTAVTSAPMGDAGAANATLSAIVLDKYQRAYQVDLGAGFSTARQQARLAPALERETRNVSMGNDALSLAFSVDASGRVAQMPWSGQLRLAPDDAVKARVLATRAVARLAPNAKIAFAFSQGADGLVAQLQGRNQPAFLIARAPIDDVGFGRNQSFSFAMRHQLGKTGLTIAAEHGSAISAAPVLDGSSNLGWTQLNPANRIGVTFDRDFGAVKAALGASWLGERRTFLGAVFHNGFGAGGANSLFLDANGEWRFADNWRLGGAWRSGYTWANTGGTVGHGSRLRSSAWSIDLGRDNLIQPGDTLGLRLSQPLRVESGGLRLTLPVAYSYDTLSPTYADRLVSLSPHGRELDAELMWRGPLYTGSAMVSLFYRRNPGHFAEAAADKGLAASWSWQF